MSCYDPRDPIPSRDPQNPPRPAMRLRYVGLAITAAAALWALGWLLWIGARP